MEPEQEQQKKLQELDQAAATSADVLPSHWQRMFLSIKSAGFTDVMAERLLFVYVNALAGGKLSP